MSTGSGNGWPGVIKVPAQTTGDEHDPFCQRDEPDHWCECALIARVRADERQRTPIVYERGLGAVDEVLAELRAQVTAAFAETLPPYLFRHNEDVLFPKMERTTLNDAIRDVWQAAEDQVLALIDGGSE